MSKPKNRGTTRPRPSGALRSGPVEFRRGDLLWIRCEPSVGVEPRKIRTCVVLSNDVANRYSMMVTVVTTRRYTAELASRAYMIDLRAPRSTLTEPRLANASQIMTYDKSRVADHAGHVTPAALREIEAALAIHLGLDAL
jgi:mRNA interferase MazF